MNPQRRTILVCILLIIALVVFAAAWYITTGNDVFDSTNSGAFIAAGLFFTVGALLTERLP